MNVIKYHWLWITAILIQWWWDATGDWKAKCHCRNTTPFPAQCHQCASVFRKRDARHNYKADGQGDVEPAEYCPKCGCDLYL